MGANCDEASTNALLRSLVGAVQGEARRQRLNLLDEASIQHLDRVCSETLSQWGKPGSDKVHQAFAKIDQVKGKMQQNLEQIINNQEEVNDMEKKSGNIQQSAFEIRQNARKLEMEARKRRCRLYAMIGCAVTVVILIIFLLIFNDWTEWTGRNEQTVWSNDFPEFW